MRCWLIKSALWRKAFDVLELKEELFQKEQKMQSPDFWNNQERAKKISEDAAILKKEIKEWEHLTGEIKTLGELAELAHDADIAKELDGRVSRLERAVGEYEIQKLFSGTYDKGSAVVSFYAGAGGKDAEDWAAMLKRMYERFAGRKKWKAKMIHEHFGENQGPSGWGVKNASIVIDGPYAYGYLKKENGVHRLVRVSPFSAQQLRHTSFALVEVMPELVAPEEVVVNPEELKIDFFRSSGPGGQNVNKRETAVRITHVPTGLTVSVQSERTQERNRDIAAQMLRAKLYQKKVALQKKEAGELRGELAANEWGSQIRSYVLHPYKLVKDHRTGFETTQIEKVLDGELDGFIEAELRT